jgi:hypothetical protein
MCWMMLFCFPLMAAMQDISVGLGRVTGQGIVGMLLLANTINLGADLGAMAAALNLLSSVAVALVVDVP